MCFNAALVMMNQGLRIVQRSNPCLTHISSCLAAHSTHTALCLPSAAHSVYSVVPSPALSCLACVHAPDECENFKSVRQEAWAFFTQGQVSLNDLRGSVILTDVSSVESNTDKGGGTNLMAL